MTDPTATPTENQSTQVWSEERDLGLHAQLLEWAHNEERKRRAEGRPREPLFGEHPQEEAQS